MEEYYSERLGYIDSVVSEMTNRLRDKFRMEEYEFLMKVTQYKMKERYFKGEN